MIKLRIRMIAGLIGGFVIATAMYFLGFGITWQLCLLLFIAMEAVSIADFIIGRYQ